MFLFIHQLGGTRSLWLPQIRSILGLDNTYSDKQLLDLFTICLPGHPDDDEELNFIKTRKIIDNFVEEKFSKQEEMAKKMVLINRPEIIKSMKSPKLVIIGHELGGTIALNYTLTNINKINRLVLIGCGNHFNQWTLKILKYYYQRLTNLNLGSLRKKYQKAKKLRFKNFLYIFSENTSRKSLESGLEMLQNFNFSKSFQKLDLDEQLLTTKIPILIIKGQFDLLCSQKSVIKFQDTLDPTKEIWQQKKAYINLGKRESSISVKIYPFSGANPMDKDPVSFAFDIRQFLKS